MELMEQNEFVEVKKYSNGNYGWTIRLQETPMTPKIIDRLREFDDKLNKAHFEKIVKEKNKK